MHASFMKKEPGVPYYAGSSQKEVSFAPLNIPF
jgi:hypothetical protein